MGARHVLGSARYKRSLGEKSAQYKQTHWLKKLGRTAVAAGIILVGAGIVGGLINGLGFWGVMVTAGLIGAAIWGFMRYPEMRVPSLENLVSSDLKTLAAKTEIWLENQRPALPAPAINILNGIGVQLDALSPQLSKLGEKEPASYEVRKLVGEHLPELIIGYRAIPLSMQRQKSDSGKSPEEQLVSGLALIEQEIASVTKQIAQGDIDNLSIRERFLELKYDKGGAAKI